jgi:alpha-ketoglutaric semialdehyde dehydrogenase
MRQLRNSYGRDSHRPTDQKASLRKKARSPGVLGPNSSLAAAVYGSQRDDDTWIEVERVLTPRVGRLVFNRATTGVKVVPAMNHGGPFPSTGHPGFTSVGVPRSLERFAKLVSFDGVPDRYLPPELQNSNPLGLWREVDGEPTFAEVH